jgi:hypothetical protein
VYRFASNEPTDARRVLLRNCVNAKPNRRLTRFEKFALLRISAALALALLANLLPESTNGSEAPRPCHTARRRIEERT